MKTTSIIILSFLSIFSVMAQPQKKKPHNPSQQSGSNVNNSVTQVQIVNIPDANFKQSLIDLGIDLNSDGQIQVSEAQIRTSLKLSSKLILSLSGIEAFINLTSLDCSDNQLTILDISKNTALTFLDCFNNKLTTIDVSKNTALTALSCTGNQLTTIDVSKNSALKILSCSSNKLSTIEISKNTALTFLDCSSNQLTTIDVSKNTALTKLKCQYNPSLLNICMNTTQLNLTTSTPSNWLKNSTSKWSSDCVR